jgi:acyl-CoA thioester hydrolase
LTDTPQPDALHPDAGRFANGEHLLPVRVYYEDTDATGIVYHGNYLRYCERGRTDFIRLAGVSHTELRARDPAIVFVVRRVELDFIRPARVDDSLLVRTRYDRLQGPRMHIDQQVERAGEVLARAKVEVVCITLDGRPVRPPHDMVNKLSGFFDRKS